MIISHTKSSSFYQLIAQLFKDEKASSAPEKPENSKQTVLVSLKYLIEVEHVVANSQDMMQITPLYYASENDNLVVIKYLVE